MKQFKKSIFVALALGLLLFGCKPDNVDPTGKNGGSGEKSVAGAFDDLHPTLDTVCKISDSIFFRSPDGSFNVNVCATDDWFSPVLEPCAPGQPKWGSLFVYNGYQYIPGDDPIHWLDVDFTLAPGIFNDLSSWTFTTGNGIQIDPNTGTPTIGTDWSSLVSNPARNQWKIQIRVDQLPQPSFDMACRMSVMRLSFFADEIPGTRTNLWAINHLWNQTGGEYASNSEFVLRYAPLGCLNTPPPPQDTTVTLGNCSGCQSSNTVRFNDANPNCVDVTSCKDLSNVVVRDCNGTDYKFDGLRSSTGTFCHPSGLPIVRVYVKSGCFDSGEGPGYGRRFDNPYNFCNN